MKNCILCKIANKEIPGDFVYSTDNIIAIRDINPQAPVHILIAPKEHLLNNLADVNANNSAIIAEIVEAAAIIAKNENLNSGWRLIANVGQDGGQTINHLHFHLLGGKNLGDTLVL